MEPTLTSVSNWLKAGRARRKNAWAYIWQETARGKSYDRVVNEMMRSPTYKKYGRARLRDIVTRMKQERRHRAARARYAAQQQANVGFARLNRERARRARAQRAMAASAVVWDMYASEATSELNMRDRVVRVTYKDPETGGEVQRVLIAPLPDDELGWRDRHRIAYAGERTFGQKEGSPRQDGIYGAIMEGTIELGEWINEFRES